MYTKENFVEKDGNVNVDKIIQESQIQWIPYDNFYDTKYIIDSENYTFHSSRLRNYMIDKLEYRGVVVLKEYRYDILEFFKEIKNNGSYSYCFAKLFGISKNPSTQNYIIVMESCRNTAHNCLSNIFRNNNWHSKISSLHEIIRGLDALHSNSLIHSDLHNRNILILNQFGDVEYNKRIMNKSQEKKLLRSLYNFHPQSCYTSRHIHTLCKLQDSLEDLKSGKYPNLYTE
ncbi:4499_t:CDS:2, partial [Diversispora eburnea]